MEAPPTSEQDLREQAIERLKKKRDFRTHLFMYVLVNAMLVAIWAITGAGFFWPAFPILGWGIGVIADSGGSLGRPCRRRSSTPGSSTGRLPSSPAEGRG